MMEKRTHEKKNTELIRLQNDPCIYLRICRKTFEAGDIRLHIEDRINLFLPWRSERVLKIAGESFLYSAVPLFHSQHRLLCYQYCADAMKMKQDSFYRHALVLGCGGGALPRWLLEEYPQLQVDVVDNSPEILSICREYFLNKWEGSDRLRYYCMDAAEFNRKDYACQFIFCDIFDGINVAPLVSEKSFAEKLYALLADEGILVINCGWNHLAEIRRVYQGVFEDLQEIDLDSGQTEVLKGRKMSSSWKDQEPGDILLQEHIEEGE